MRSFSSAIGSVVAAACVGVLSEPPPSQAAQDAQGTTLPRPQFLHVLGAAQQSLLADYFWIETVEHIGAARTAEAHRNIYPYADLTTDLDPNFRIVYVYAATIIPLEIGREQWVNEAESTALIKKGLQVFPRDYQLRFMLAYNLQYITKQYAEAARVVDELAHDPKAPSWLSGLATRLYAQAGKFDAGLALAESLRDAATDEATREFFEHRILQIQQEQVLRELDAAASHFREREGRPPLTVVELVTSGDLPSVPLDPLQGSFFFDSSGRAQSTSAEHRLELFQDKAHRAAAAP